MAPFTSYMKQLESDAEDWPGKQDLLKHLRSAVECDLRKATDITYIGAYVPSNPFAIIDILHDGSAEHHNLSERRFYYPRFYGGYKSCMDDVILDREKWLDEDLKRLRSDASGVRDRLVILSNSQRRRPISGFDIELFGTAYKIPPQIFWYFVHRSCYFDEYRASLNDDHWLSPFDGHARYCVYSFKSMADLGGLWLLHVGETSINDAVVNLGEALKIEWTVTFLIFLSTVIIFEDIDLEESDQDNDNGFCVFQGEHQFTYSAQAHRKFEVSSMLINSHCSHKILWLNCIQVSCRRCSKHSYGVRSQMYWKRHLR